MRVELLHHTPLWVCSKAIRKCWASEDKSDSNFDSSLRCCTELDEQGELCKAEAGEKDKALIDRVGNKNKHQSVLEHLSYNFDISGVSRALLQELARHRMSSFSVKSTRYTLKELKNGFDFINAEYDNLTMAEVSRFIVLSDNSDINYYGFLALQRLQKALKGNSNDVAKYVMPESYKTSLVWTINARSLQNFLQLRTNRSALKEIRDLAYSIFEVLPDEHKYLFEECIHKENSDNND